MADKESKKETKKPEQKPIVKRDEYVVLHTRNFGTGEVQAGKTIRMSAGAAEHYLDKGLIKKNK